MNKAFEKIINRIDKEITVYTGKAKQIVREVAEEYKDKPNIIDGLKIFLQEKFNYCAEQAEMNLEAECNSEIASYFRDRKELYLDRANIYGKVMREIDRIAQEYNNGWIPCSERLPEEGEDVLDQKQRCGTLDVIDDPSALRHHRRHMGKIVIQQHQL